MSVTITEILKLPSLQGARVVAGEAGLDRWISTISVLEYARLDQFTEIYYDYYGSELLISAFYALRDNVETQCNVIEALNSKESAGLILFYVGAILPYVDDRLIELADRLAFPIIVMPENRIDLRYGEVIYEVMEAILKSQFIGYDLKNDVIEQVARLPGYQRSVGTAMRILSDKTHASIILAEPSGQPLNVSVWPRNMTAESYLRDGRVLQVGPQVRLGDEQYQVSSCPVNASGGMPLQAVIYKRGEPLAADVARQVGEAIQIAMNLWEGQGENLISELVGAVLKDEPYKISRIATLFGVKVEGIREMWIIAPLAGGPEALAKQLPGLISEELSHLCDTVVFDAYDGGVVVLLDTPKTGADTQAAAQSFCAALAQSGLEATVTACRGLQSPAHLRKAYLTYRESLTTAREIYPGRRLFSLSDLRFAGRCKKIIESGEAAVGQYTEILDGIPRDDGVSYDDMLRTLATYYLDAHGSAAVAGELLFLHKNTIQYRIRKLRGHVADGMDDQPELIELYTALALSRILAVGRAEG